jgi:H+-transporting ATPase
MTGDGVNDAPALKKADVGIAVSGSTDAARAAADIVLTDEGLSTIIEGIIISRCIFQRMKNFITYRIAATIQLLVFFFIAVLFLHPQEYMPNDCKNRTSLCPEDFDEISWPSFFRMPVLMLMLITLLNDGTLIAIGYDNVLPSKQPNDWNLKVVFTVSTVLAFVALISSLLLLHILLDSWTEDGFFHFLGLGPLSFGQITTSMYLKVSISDFLTLFSARTHDGYFYSSKPSPILIGATVFSLLLSTILACVWPSSYPDDIYALGLGLREPKMLAFLIWIYCILWFFIQDKAKVMCYNSLHKHNIFSINNSIISNNVKDIMNSINDEEHDLLLSNV